MMSAHVPIEDDKSSPPPQPPSTFLPPRFISINLSICAILTLGLILAMIQFQLSQPKYESPAFLRSKRNAVVPLTTFPMVVVLDTYSGLCNQIGDLNDGINFCLYHNLTFTVRYASFRNKDLSSWYPVPFTEIFNDSFLADIPLYVNYSSISHLMNSENTVNFNGKISSHHLFNKRQSLLPQMYAFNKSYIVLTQCFCICLPPGLRNNFYRFYHIIGPSTKLLNEYERIRDQLFTPNEEYNFLHYRYERDFIDYFKVSMKSLENVINATQYHNQSLKLYVASTNIDRLINVNAFNGSIVFKNESELTHLNFEQKAMIDFLFGIHAKEVVGHSNSSFSHVLNGFHHSNNYYARKKY